MAVLTFRMFVIFVNLIVCSVCKQPTCSVTLEAENGVGGKQMYRLAASGGIDVLLMKGQTISEKILLHDTYTNNTCVLKLLNVVYSNDGIGDDVTVSANNIQLGSFKSDAKSGSGERWNSFRNVMGFSTELEVIVGEYNITVEVMEADEYGIEIDTLTLLVDCATFRNNDTETAVSVCPPSLVTVDNDMEVGATDETDYPVVGGLSKGNSDEAHNTNRKNETIFSIILVIFGGLALVFGVPGTVYATKKVYRCISDGQLRKKEANEAAQMLKVELMDMC